PRLSKRDEFARGQGGARRRRRQGRGAETGRRGAQAGRRGAQAGRRSAETGPGAEARGRRRPARRGAQAGPPDSPGARAVAVAFSGAWGDGTAARQAADRRLSASYQSAFQSPTIWPTLTFSRFQTLMPAILRISVPSPRSS